MNEIPTADHQLRWFRLTPGRFVLLLLAVEVLLWLSERFGWLGWHKGYAVLTAVAVVGVGVVLMVVWFAVAAIFRWRFQFSIRSLLVLAVVVALPCSWLAVEIKKAREQKATTVEITKWRGTVMYDYLLDSSGQLMLTAQPPEPPWLRNLFGDDFFMHVVSVLFYGTEITDAQLDRLNTLPKLQSLAVSQTHVTDAGLANLKGLNLLWSLRLDGTRITNAGLEHVQGLNQLRKLDLSSTKVMDAGIGNLTALTQLNWLDLDSTRLTNAGLLSLKKLTALRILVLGHTQVTDAGLKHLRTLSQLNELSLQGTQVTDAGLVELEGLNQLKFLLLGGTKVTAAGVAKLQQALPNCTITR